MSGTNVVDVLQCCTRPAAWPAVSTHTQQYHRYPSVHNSTLLQTTDADGACSHAKQIQGQPVTYVYCVGTQPCSYTYGHVYMKESSFSS